MESKEDSSFLARNEFLIRRLFSLCGLVPVGAYMVVHLTTNSLMLNGPAAFQKAVNQIHSLGVMLPVVEWLFIFLPIIFHAVIGVIIIKSGQTNYGSYKTTSNARFTAQRLTGMIAFLFIFWHVFHMHGWIHADWWLDGPAKGLGGAQFDPLHATSTTIQAFNANFFVPILYAIGVLSCVFHLSNGIWTAGITWGVWTSPAAMARASKACIGFGIIVGVIGLSGISSGRGGDQANAESVEAQIIQQRIDAGELPKDTPLYREDSLHETNKESDDTNASSSSPADTEDTPSNEN